MGFRIRGASAIGNIRTEGAEDRGNLPHNPAAALKCHCHDLTPKPTSPLDLFPVSEEPPGGALVVERRKPDGAVGALVRGSLCALTSHARAHPAWAHRVDLHRCGEFFRETDGEGVEGGLRHAVCAGAAHAFGE